MLLRRRIVVASCRIAASLGLMLAVALACARPGAAESPSFGDLEPCVSARTPEGVIKICTDLIVRIPKPGDSMDPEDAALLFEAHKFRAHAYTNLKQFDRAIDDYSAMIKLKPKDQYSYESRASVYKALGDLERAIADYGTAIEVAPARPVIYGARARLYEKKGDFDRAIADYSAAIRRADPQFAAGDIVNRGDAYRIHGDLDRAIADYDAALKLSPKFVPAFYGRSRAKQAKGDAVGAAADMAQAKKINPTLDADIEKGRKFDPDFGR
jgi:tetratricopeptide (TPR) repeat protein